jgi:hypothetical protein
MGGQRRAADFCGPLFTMSGQAAEHAVSREANERAHPGTNYVPQA